MFIQSTIEIYTVQYIYVLLHYLPYLCSTERGLKYQSEASLADLLFDLNLIIVYKDVLQNQTLL